MNRGIFDPEQISDAKPTHTLKTAVAILVLRWRLVLIWGLCGFAAAALLSFLVPNKYTATTSILPLTDSQQNGGLMKLAEGISGLDFITLPEKSPTALFPEIMTSDSVMSEVLSTRYPIRRGNKVINQTLFEYFRQNNRDAALRALSKILSFDSNKKTGVIKVRATTTDPELSAAICNRLVDRLDNFNKTRRKTSATQNREFIEKRIDQLKTELTAAEDNLKEFRQHNLNYYRAVDPELILLESRLAREVELKSQLYLTLAQQYELAAIQEKKESPIVQVLDIARPPTIKSSPARLKIAFTGFVLGALMPIILLTFGKNIPKNLRILRLKKTTPSANETRVDDRFEIITDSVNRVIHTEHGG